MKILTFGLSQGRVWMLIFGIASSLLLGSACTPTGSTGETSIAVADPEEPYPDPATLAQLMEQTLERDSSLFPFVYQGPGRSLIFEAYTMRFALTNPTDLAPMRNNQVPWVNPERYNVNNGLFATYVRNGRELKMENPYIQVQYINRSLPYCGTVDSIYMWLDSQFLKNPDAEVLQETMDMPINLGGKALTKEYKTGNPAARVVKYLAYAYVPYDDDYIVGFALTTIDRSDFDNTRQPFYQLVKSFTPVPR
ncbi:MAG: hypothetical protein D6722_02985 [Bacteroidetes bacterium]|nr:MAG: hypothetical protein D6722_02985 [Bacteroidota bacterium]